MPRVSSCTQGQLLDGGLEVFMRYIIYLKLLANSDATGAPPYSKTISVNTHPSSNLPVNRRTRIYAPTSSSTNLAQYTSCLVEARNGKGKLVQEAHDAIEVNCLQVDKFSVSHDEVKGRVKEVEQDLPHDSVSTTSPSLSARPRGSFIEM